MSPAEQVAVKPEQGNAEEVVVKVEDISALSWLQVQ